MSYPFLLTYTGEPEFHGLALKSEWLKILNLKSHCSKDVVCINHFRQKFDYCVLPNGKYRLGQGVVPSLCIKTLDKNIQTMPESPKAQDIISDNKVQFVEVKMEAPEETKSENIKLVDCEDNYLQSSKQANIDTLSNADIKLEQSNENIFVTEDISNDKSDNMIINVHERSDNIKYDKSLSSSKKLDKHKCEKCGKDYIYPGCLKVHICQNNVRNHKCETCDKAFSQMSHLNDHIKVVHEGIKEHKCLTCDKSFGYESNLRSHMKFVHEGLKNHTCKACGRKFGRLRNMRKHFKLVHEGQKDFKCETCGVKFSHIWDLNRHIKVVHEGIKDYICTKCGKAFGMRNTLSNHIKAVHEGLKQHKCDHCGKGFSLASELNRHVKKVHPGQTNVGYL